MAGSAHPLFRADRGLGGRTLDGGPPGLPQGGVLPGRHGVRVTPRV